MDLVWYGETLNWSILRNRIRSVGLGFLGQVYLCLTLASYWVPLELKGGMERKELDADTYLILMLGWTGEDSHPLTPVPYDQVRISGSPACDDD